MDQRVRPSPRLAPLPPEHTPELTDQFESMRRNLGFIPNSISSCSAVRNWQRRSPS
jgi:hypothetical protein